MAAARPPTRRHERNIARLKRVCPAATIRPASSTRCQVTYSRAATFEARLQSRSHITLDCEWSAGVLARVFDFLHSREVSWVFLPGLSLLSLVWSDSPRLQDYATGVGLMCNTRHRHEWEVLALDRVMRAFCCKLASLASWRFWIAHPFF